VKALANRAQQNFCCFFHSERVFEGIEDHRDINEVALDHHSDQRQGFVQRL
jgi:hypothetical protein